MGGYSGNTNNNNNEPGPKLNPNLALILRKKIGAHILSIVIVIIHTDVGGVVASKLGKG